MDAPGQSSGGPPTQAGAASPPIAPSESNAQGGHPVSHSTRRRHSSRTRSASASGAGNNEAGRAEPSAAHRRGRKPRAHRHGQRAPSQSNPFRAETELFELGHSEEARAGSGRGALDGPAGLTALPPMPGGDPRRRDGPSHHPRASRDHRTVAFATDIVEEAQQSARGSPLSSCSSASLPSAPSAAAAPTRRRTTITDPLPRDRDGNIIVSFGDGAEDTDSSTSETMALPLARRIDSRRSRREHDAGARGASASSDGQERPHGRRRKRSKGSSRGVERTKSGVRSGSRQRKHRDSAVNGVQDAAGSESGHEGRAAASPSSQDDSDSAVYDYDPDHPEVLDEKARLLQQQVRQHDDAVQAGNPSGVQRLPCPFQAAPIPYWVQRVSDLLLFHNGAQVCASPELLPADAAVLQLQADLREARHLLDEVEHGRDWGFMRTRTARRYEVYSAPGDDEADAGPRAGGATETEMQPAAAPPSAAESGEVQVTVHADTPRGGDAAHDEHSSNDGKEGSSSSSSSKRARRRAAKSLAAQPLLPAAEEARDELLPTMQRQIPLWRRRGAASKTIRELIGYLETRLQILESKIKDPLDGRWYMTMGAANSSGVDGTQRATLPPALEQAYATTMTNAILSDLFVSPFAGVGLRERAARISTAFLPQIPKIHAHFVVEEDFRPVYDSLLVRKADMLEPTYPSALLRPTAAADGAGSSGDDGRRSFTVHVDYIRLHPPPIPGFLMMMAHAASAGGDTDDASAAAPSLWNMASEALGGDGDEDAFAHLIANTQMQTSLLSGNALEDTLVMMDSVADAALGAATKAARGRPPSAPSTPSRRHLGREEAETGVTVRALRFGPAAAGALSLLSLATTQSNTLVPFTPEAYLVAMLLQHYERYRLLRLNLLPHLKCRFFYEEQIEHLARQPSRTADVDELQAQLSFLRDKAADLERAALTAMIALWRAVLQLRAQHSSSPTANGSEIPFVVPTHRAARYAAASAAPSARSNDDDGCTQVRVRAPAHTGNGATATGDDDGDHLQGRRNVRELDVFSTDASELLHERDDLFSTRTAAAAGGEFTATEASSPAGALFTSMTLASAPRGEAPSAYNSLLLGPSAPSPGSSSVQEDADGPARETLYVSNESRATQFRFFLRRYGELAEVPYVEDTDVLRYEPVVEGADALAAAATPLNAPGPVSADVGEDGEPHAGGQAEAAAPEASKLQFFQVAVFARASAAVSPQYVGCTLPRPLTAANAIFFNESFEVRVLREPVEIILHVISVSEGAGKGMVVATVRLQPTLTRSYLLLPLQSPVTFTFRKRLLERYAGIPLAGVLSASTTWTTTQGMTIPQIERLFMSGAADPLDPAYAPLLRVLKGYYQDAERNAAEDNERQRLRAEAAAAAAVPGVGRRRAGRRKAAVVAEDDYLLGTPAVGVAKRGARDSRSSSPAGNGEAALGSAWKHPGSPVECGQHGAVDDEGGSARRSQLTRWTGRDQQSSRLLARLGIPIQVLLENDGADGFNSATGFWRVGKPAIGELSSTRQSALGMLSERLLLMRRRWHILSGQAKPINDAEAALTACPIPYARSDQYELLRWLKREQDRSAAERRVAYGVGDGQIVELFDEEAYHAAPSSVSGLALSPLAKETKLKLWQERQRRIKLTREPARELTDEQKLDQVVTVPKFSIVLVLHVKPRSQFNPRRAKRPENSKIDRASLNRRRDSRIIVHVMKANNLPERADGTPLEPFVQASFVYENAYSRCEVGSSPSWFETLEMPFQPLDFDEDTLSMIDDDIIISVYDKVEIAMPPSTITRGAVAHETHYRTERRLVGTLRVPFYSLHQADKARMEGVYPLNTPRWLLGYNVGAQDDMMPNPFTGLDTYGNSGHRPVSARPTIQLYLSLWPPLQRDKRRKTDQAVVARQVRQANVSPELAYLHEVVLKWQSKARSKIKSIMQMNAQANQRDVEPFVMCSTGDLVLACRYLLPRGGPPPRTVTNVFEAIRYVSLLPFAVDIMTWGDKDVWSTNVELLAMRGGDYEELALLLVHFLHHLAPDHISYVVVGEGEIYAQTIMVLHAFDGTQLRLIDPRTGWIAPVERPFGTILRDVQYVFSHDQLWANVQMSGLPHRMTWDFTNPAYWLPCFEARDRRTQACLPSLCPIQREVLTFKPVDTMKAKEIEIDLHATVRKSLLAWRNHRPPAFHRGVEAILRDLLVIAEDERCACGSVQHPNVTVCARERLAEYFGMPIDGVTVSGPQSRSEAAAGTSHRRRRGRHHAAPDGDDGEDATAVGGAASRKDGRHRRRSSSSSAAAAVTFDDSDGSADGNEDRDGRQTALVVAPSTRTSHAGRTRLQPCIHLVGAPVTSSYSSADKHYYAILQQVFACAAHEVGTDDVSFAAGVYVRGYTGDVFAMWVFLVAICRGVQEEVVVDSPDENVSM